MEKESVDFEVVEALEPKRKEEEITIETAPAKKHYTKFIFIILVALLLLAIVIVLAYLGYEYLTSKIEPNETDVTMPPNQTNVNGTTPVNDTNINDTSKSNLCGNGKCDSKENYTNCPKDCKKQTGPGPGGPSGPSCTPNCTNKQCGGDGCEGSCGTCNASYECNSTFSCSKIPCTNDTGCNSRGSFCDVINNMPYTCDYPAGGDGCLDRINQSKCETPKVCESGSCVEVHIIFVDNILTTKCPAYNPETRSCAGGSETAFNNLTSALSNVSAGDTVMIRGGTYNEVFKPANSGTQSNPIIYKGYNNEAVVISGTAYDARAASCPGDPNLYYGPIWLEYINYTIVDGLNFSNVEGFGRITRSHHNTFKNCNFDGINSGWIIGLNLFESSSNRFENNKFEGAADNFRLIHSNSNIIQGNNFHNASHVLLTLKCSSYNIVRNNYLYNEIQKAMEVLDCEQPTMEDHYNIYCQSTSILNSSKHNLIESNTFAYTSPEEGYGDGPFNHIQYAGQEGIIRNNLFYDSNGIALGMAHYGPEEALYNKFNRVYNNVFYNNTGGGVETGRISPDLFDNIFKNNILYKNYPGPVHWADDYPSGSQITHGGMANFLFENNNIINSTPGDSDIIYDSYNHRITLTTAQANYPSLYKSNVEANPLFVNANSHDFHLQSTSPMINAGTFLTKTSGAGSGTTINIEDARYFYDGFGIGGEQGDSIQLDGQTTTARIVDINYATNTLTLDRSLTWNNGQGISLAYSGSKPDIGAYEYSGGGGGSEEGMSETSAQSEKEMPSKSSSIISQIYQFFKGFLTGNTIKEITGYFLK